MRTAPHPKARTAALIVVGISLATLTACFPDPPPPPPPPPPADPTTSVVGTTEVDQYPTVSDDGNVVAYLSAGEVRVQNRTAGTNIAVAPYQHWLPDGDDGSLDAQTPARHRTAELDLSSDGRYLAFISSADDIVFGDDGEDDDVFVHDVVAGTTTKVPDGSHLDAFNVSISGDGNVVSFQSRPDGYPTLVQNHLWDRATDSVTTLSDAWAIQFPDQISPISHNGRYLTWSTLYKNLPEDTDDVFDCYVYDIQTSTLTLVPLPVDAISCYTPSVLDDGGIAAVITFPGTPVVAVAYFVWHPGVSTYTHPSSFRSLVGTDAMGTLLTEVEPFMLTPTDIGINVSQWTPGPDTSSPVGTGQFYGIDTSSTGRFVVWSDGADILLWDRGV